MSSHQGSDYNGVWGDVSLTPALYAIFRLVTWCCMGGSRVCLQLLSCTIIACWSWCQTHHLLNLWCMYCRSTSGSRVCQWFGGVMSASAYVRYKLGDWNEGEIGIDRVAGAKWTVLWCSGKRSQHSCYGEYEVFVIAALSLFILRSSHILDHCWLLTLIQWRVMSVGLRCL